MKILTLNTWQEKGAWRLRWQVTFEGIAAMRPGIAAFQEVFNPDWAQEVKRTAGFPYLVFHPEPSGLMLLSEYPVRESACLTMGTKSPTEDYLRYVLFAELSVGKRRLAVFNTHLSWMMDEGLVREKQVEELLAFIGEKSRGRDAVVMGDFNAPPGTPEIKKMPAAGFTDAFGSLYPKDQGFTWNNENPYARNSNPPMPDRRIDYIFFRSSNKFLNRMNSVGLVFTQPSSSGIWASDHFGLLADFEVPE